MIKLLSKQLLIGITVAVLVSIFFSILSPLHITIDHPLSTEIKVLANGQVLKPTVKSRLSDQTIVIKNLSAKGEVVELALPIKEDGRRLKPEEILSKSEGWKFTYGGERIESFEKNSILTLKYRTWNLELPFLQRKDGGRVSINANGLYREVNLSSAAYGWRPVVLPSKEVSTICYLGLFLLVNKIEVNIPTSGDEVTGRINVGGGKEFIKFQASKKDSFKQEISWKDKVNFLFGNILCIGSYALILVFMSLVFSMIGCLILNRKKSWIIDLTNLAVGFSSFALLNNTLNYFFTTKQIAIYLSILIISIVVISTWQLINGKKSLYPNSGENYYKSGIIPAVVSVCLSFWPVTFVGIAYLGYLQTDSFFYTTVSAALQNNSMFDLINNEGVIGFGMRSLDLSFAATFSSISTFNLGKSWLLICIFFMLLPPIATYEFVKNWLGNERVALISSWGVAISAPLAGLFFESYFVQYIFSSFIYINLLTGEAFYRSFENSTVSWKSCGPFILTTALLFSIYPYFAVLPIVIIFYTLLHSIHNNQFKAFCRFMLMLVLFINIGFLSFANFGATKSFVAELNKIAEYTVFPFYAQLKFPLFLFGLVPFHGGAEIFAILDNEFGGSLVFEFLSSYTKVLNTLIVIFFILGCITTYITLLCQRKDIFLRSFGKVLPVTLLMYLFLMIISYRFSGLYAFAKLSWTASTFLPLCLIPLFAYKAKPGKFRFEKYVASFGTIFLLILLMGNLISKIASPLFWISNPNGATSERFNTFSAADILSINTMTLPLGDNTSYIFSSSKDKSFDQKLQVTTAHIFANLYSEGFYCENCNISKYLLDFRGFDSERKIFSRHPSEILFENNRISEIRN